MGIIRSHPNFATVIFPYTHNFLPSYEKIAQSKGNLAHPNMQGMTVVVLATIYMRTCILLVWLHPHSMKVQAK